LSTEGINITTPHGPKTLKARLLSCVFDLPAKAASLNFNQWNGMHGCNICLDVGVTVSHRHLYLPDEGHAVRSEDDVARSACKVIRLNHPVHGVKEVSVLAPYLNPFTGGFFF
jgi:hypothetical protein